MSDPARLIAHRGWWYPDHAAQNQPAALTTALARGWGLEFDVAFLHGEFVVSHDGRQRDAHAYRLDCDLIAALSRATAPLLFNVKTAECGPHLATLFAGYPLVARHAWVFDVELIDPDLPHRFPQLRYLARASERDTEPLAVACAQPWASGVWLDTWAQEWVTPAVIGQVKASGKEAFVVSPELHQRPIATADWRAWLDAGAYVCTDLPHYAAALDDPALPLHPVDPWWQ